MLRYMTKRSAVVAALALAIGAAAAVRAEPTTAPAGKASVVVSVVDQDGKPVVGATVNLTAGTAKHKKAGKAKAAEPTAAEVPATQPAAGDGEKPAKPVPLATATTDADGKATLAGVADGAYTVQARLKKVGTVRVSVTVADGKDAAVTVTLKPKGQPK